MHVACGDTPGSSRLCGTTRPRASRFPCLAALECLTTPELRELYIKNEGHDNRGLLFYHLVGRTFERGANEVAPAISPQAVEIALGGPDFVRKVTDAAVGDRISYGYLFSYKKKKDWVIIVVFSNGTLDSIEAAVFDAVFKERWGID